MLVRHLKHLDVRGSMNENQKNPPSKQETRDPSNNAPRGLEALLWEFFDSIFKHIIPGSIALYLYAPCLAGDAMKSSGFVSTFMFLSLAWVGGVTLDILSYHVVKFPLDILSEQNKCLKIKSWAKSLHKQFFPDLSWAADQVGHSGLREVGVKWRMWFAIKSMFRSMIGISFFVWVSAFVWDLSPSNWPTGDQGLSLKLGLLPVALLCFLLVHREHEKKVKDDDWSTRAAIRTETVEYQQGGTTLEGFVAYDDAIKGARPGVLVVHQWLGLTDYEKKRAEMLAQLGYIAFCADIYGKGVRPQNTKEASTLAGKYKSDCQLLRARVNAGLDALRQQALVDQKRIAAIGYCFGGTTVLELARSGADLNGVVSFHGGLDSPPSADGKNIKCKVLVLHGADDPFSSPQDIAAFENEMRSGGVDWQLIKYGGAVHAFTQWNAGSDNSKGAAYNERADKHSWEDMKLFFAEIFK
jgi:dienelactone hydrolase